MRVVLLALVAACQYTAPGGEAMVDSAPGIDGPAGTGDSGIDTGSSCVEGARACIDASHSGSCQGGQLVADRDCPPSSTCTAGVCAPPIGAIACTGDQGCLNNQICDVYVVGGALQGFCTPKLGNNSGSCSNVGNDPTCDSGICVSGGDSRCLSPCTTIADCVGGSSQECVAVSGPTTIEGQAISGLQHCIPE